MDIHVAYILGGLWYFHILPAARLLRAHDPGRGVRAVMLQATEERLIGLCELCCEVDHILGDAGNPFPDRLGDIRIPD